METDKLKLYTQPQITIFAALDSSNNVQLFLANSGVALGASHHVKDTFSGSTENLSVTVTVVSTNGQVIVTNKSDSPSSWTWTNELSEDLGDVTLYYAQGTGDMLSKVAKVKDKFTISVDGVIADPSVVISRGGTGTNLVVGSEPKQG